MAACAALTVAPSAFCVPAQVQVRKHEQNMDDRILQEGPDPSPLNMTLVNHFGYEVICSDIWGYEAPDGREYALIGILNGTSIVEIERSGNLVERAFIPGVVSKWRDLKTLGHYAFVVSDQMEGGMQIIDLSPLPAAASLAATFTGFKNAHNLFIDEDRALAYVVGTRIGRGGLRIYDLSDPLAPVIVGVWDRHYTHDVFVNGTAAYTFNGNRGVSVLDVSDPANPIQRQIIEYNGMSFTHSGWASEDGNLLAVCDEFDELTGGFENTRVLFFTRDGPDDIYRRSYTYIGPNRAIDHNVFLWGPYAVLSNYTYGVVLVRIDDLENLHLYGRYDTFPEDNGLAFAGAWGVYPYLPSGRILVSDINRGLHVLQLDRDLDGVADSAETNTGVFIDALDAGTDPERADTDGDGLLDGIEIRLGTDPNAADTDGDGIDDRLELTFGSDPLDAISYFEVPAIRGWRGAALLMALMIGTALGRIRARRVTSASMRRPR